VNFAQGEVSIDGGVMLTDDPLEAEEMRVQCLRFDCVVEVGMLAMPNPRPNIYDRG